MASSPIARPRGMIYKRRTTTTNSSSSYHHNSAQSRPHPLICTGAEPIHPVHCPRNLPAWPWPPETRSFFCHFGGFFVIDPDATPTCMSSCAPSASNMQASPSNLSRHTRVEKSSVQLQETSFQNGCVIPNPQFGERMCISGPCRTRPVGLGTPGNANKHGIPKKPRGVSDFSFFSLTFAGY